MKLQQVSDHCYAALNETNLVCDANSGLVNAGPGMVVDTQSDLPHARKMIELFDTVWEGMPRYVALTHEDIDHVAGNQLFPGAEIIAHRAVAERMAKVADPSESEKLTHSVHHLISRTVLRAAHPGVLAVARQLDANFDFEGIEVVLPTTVFDERHVVDLDGTQVHLIHVGAAHQAGDAIVHVPSEGVLFAGDLLFNESTPMGWVGSYQAFSDALDRIIDLAPATIVPGHGPVCGLDAVRAEQAYFASVLAQAKECFDEGLSARDAAARIDLGPYREWKAPARLVINVERAYREFRGDLLDTPWELPAIFDGMYHVAKDRDLPVEF
ncbi:MAG TPA: MBL fold metallo-hydrolase [Dermatophilaceae bacterium]|nr:MBL fold metallo-hydrolase [Dermatophilaceae bacterium]